MWLNNIFGNNRKSDKSGSDLNNEVNFGLQREKRFGFQLIIVSLLVLFAWILGYKQCSLAWAVFVTVLVIIIWKSTFVSLLEDSVKFEENRIHRQRALHNLETAEWLNFIINRWWLASSQTIYNLVKDTVDPLLTSNKPHFLESIELVHFTVGDGTPFVKFVSSYDVRGDANADRNQKVNRQIAIESDIELCSQDFKMIFKTRLGGKGLGIDLDVSIEKLNFSGKLYAIFDLNSQLPFPHIPKLTLTFIKKPDVWFNIRILKSVQMMEVPILKTWIHSLVMAALTTALVDPGTLDIDLFPVENDVTAETESNGSLAVGVLTITVSATQHGKLASWTPLSEDSKWCVLRLRDQKHTTGFIQSDTKWQECCSFILHNLSEDYVTLKTKSKRLITPVTLSQHTFKLSDLNLETNKVFEAVVNKKNQTGPNLNMKGNSPVLTLKIEYTPLASVAEYQNQEINRKDNALFVPNQDSTETSKEASGVCGIMYVCVHSAEFWIVSGEKEANPPSPYCLVLNNRKKIRTTHYICDSENPSWESTVEFLVTDYTQAVMTFVICNWNGETVSSDTDLVGFCSFTLPRDRTCVTKEKLPLTQYSASDETVGTVTVSVLFRSVNSVFHSEMSLVQNNLATSQSRGSIKARPRRKKSLIGSSKDGDAPQRDIMNLLSHGSGVVELTVISAIDLVSKDLNGFSDPYCEVRVSDEIVFKTSVKKKTLNPEWNESVTIKLPKPNESLRVVVWDWDTFGWSDFIGDLTLTLEDIRCQSVKDEPGWFELHNTKSGSIQLQFRIVFESVTSERRNSSIIALSDQYQACDGKQSEHNGSNQDCGKESGFSLDTPNQYTGQDTFRQLGIKNLLSSDRDLNASAEDSLKLSNRRHDRRYRSLQLFGDKLMGKLKKSPSTSCVQDVPEDISINRSIQRKSSFQMIDHQYHNIRGCVYQIDNIDGADCNEEVYCKVKLKSGSYCDKKKRELTIAKSAPVVINNNESMLINLKFKIDVFRGIHSKNQLLIEAIKIGKYKQVVARVVVPLYHLFKGVGEEEETKHVLEMTPCGRASVFISHGKPMQRQFLKQAPRILRSWSLHKDRKL